MRTESTESTGSTESTDIVLISPPVYKACEPLLGMGTLKAFLAPHGVSVVCIDANAEAQEWLLNRDRIDARVAQLSAEVTQTVRLSKLVRSWPTIRPQLAHLKAAMRSREAYETFNGYRTAVTSLNRVMSLAGALKSPELGSPITASLTDYLDARVCDMASESVAESARRPQDNLFFEYFQDVLIPKVAAHKPRVVGLSIIFRNQLLCGLALATLLRRALPAVHITLGGELVSAWADHIQETALLDLTDSIIPYEGELGLLALGQGKPLTEVPNLIARTPDGGLIRNPTAQVNALADVPAPDFTWAPWSLYFSPEKTAPMVTARGCYWNRCTFCPEVINPETRLRLARVDRIGRDMDTVHAQTGATMFHFIDSAIPPKLLKGIANHVRNGGLPYRWYGFSRLETHLFREGFAETLAEGGCQMLMLGLETASQRLLDAMDKNQDIHDVSRVLHALRQSKILVHAFLMFGTPLEEAPDAETTREFVAQHHRSIQFLNCSLMNLAKGSPMAVAPDRHGIKRVIPFEIGQHTTDLALYANFEGQGWGRVGARHFLHRIFLREPGIREAHLRTPPHFDSNHSVFFHDRVFGAKPTLSEWATPAPKSTVLEPS